MLKTCLVVLLLSGPAVCGCGGEESAGPSQQPSATIESVDLSSTTLTIDGTGVPYTATIINGGSSALTDVGLQGWIHQGSAVRAAGGALVICGAEIGDLPPGTCNHGFTLLASNTGSGSGTLVPGIATARFELLVFQDGESSLLDSITASVTLVN